MARERDLHDHFFREAKRNGFRSRAAYKLIEIDDRRKLIVVHRWDRGGPGDDTLVVLNLSTHPVTDYPIATPHDGWWRLRCNTDAPQFGDGFGAVHVGDIEARNGCASVTIGPYAALVFSR